MGKEVFVPIEDVLLGIEAPNDFVENCIIWSSNDFICCCICCNCNKIDSWIWNIFSTIKGLRNVFDTSSTKWLLWWKKEEGGGGEALLLGGASLKVNEPSEGPKYFKNSALSTLIMNINI